MVLNTIRILIFFMLPTRAWEFGVGIVIQLIQSKGLEKHIFNYHKKFLYYLGAILTLFSLLIFRNSIEHLDKLLDFSFLCWELDY